MFNRWGPYFTSDVIPFSQLATSQVTRFSPLPLHENNQTVEGTAALAGKGWVGRVWTHLTLPRSRKIKVITAITTEIEQHPLKKIFDMISYLLLVPEDNF